jgi:hypothetical protein
VVLTSECHDGKPPDILDFEIAALRCSASRRAISARNDDKIDFCNSPLIGGPHLHQKSKNGRTSPRRASARGSALRSGVLCHSIFSTTDGELLTALID